MSVSVHILAGSTFCMWNAERREYKSTIKYSPKSCIRRSIENKWRTHVCVCVCVCVRACVCYVCSWLCDDSVRRLATVFFTVQGQWDRYKARPMMALSQMTGGPEKLRCRDR